MDVIWTLFRWFVFGTFGIIVIGCFGVVAWEIVDAGHATVAVLFIVAALATGYVMEKAGLP